MKTLEDIIKRKKEINDQLSGETLSADVLKTLEVELDELDVQQRTIEENIERRNKMKERILNTTSESAVVATAPIEQRNIVGADSVEYRNAWRKHILGEPMNDVEQRAFTHTTANTGVLIPTTLSDRIRTTLIKKFPLLNDVYSTDIKGNVQIPVHISVDEGAAGIVAEGTANGDEKNTFATVTIGSKTILKSFELTTMVREMSTDDFIDYMYKETIDSKDGVNASITKDVILANIKTALPASNKIDTAEPGTLSVADMLGAFGTIDGDSGFTIYVNNQTLYNHIMQMKVTDGTQPYIVDVADGFVGRFLGQPVKVDSCIPAGEVLILNPDEFHLNYNKRPSFKSGEDVKTLKEVVTGYAFVDGALVLPESAALIEIGTAAP